MSPGPVIASWGLSGAPNIREKTGRARKKRFIRLLREPHCVTLRRKREAGKYFRVAAPSGFSKTRGRTPLHSDEYCGNTPPERQAPCAAAIWPGMEPYQDVKLQFLVFSFLSTTMPSVSFGWNFISRRALNFSTNNSDVPSTGSLSPMLTKVGYRALVPFV